MSKLFKNSDLNNIFTESSFDFPTHATIVDINNNTSLRNNTFSEANTFSGANTFSATSEVGSQLGGATLSATSSVLRQSQLGGATLSATSSNNMTNIVKQSGGNNTDSKDVDALLAMLTSENNLSDSENTNTVEERLKNVLNTQAGGNSGLEQLPSLFTSEVFSEVQPLSYVPSLSGGGTRFIINEDLEIDQDGGARGTNPGMAAFLKLKKFVAEKLNISNGVPAGKVAGAVLREVKSKYQNITTQEAVEKAMKHLEKNLDKFKKML